MDKRIYDIVLDTLKKSAPGLSNTTRQAIARSIGLKATQQATQQATSKGREGVLTANMHFCGEPTADGDNAALYLREWYEENRETWWDRYQRPPLNDPRADNLMLGLYDEVLRIEAEKQQQVQVLVDRNERLSRPDPGTAVKDSPLWTAEQRRLSLSNHMDYYGKSLGWKDD